MGLNAEMVAMIPRPGEDGRGVGKINLNAGTLHPTPKPVRERAEELRGMMATNPSDFCWRRTPGLLQEARGALAGYLGVPADELLLLPNITFAVNLVVSSLALLRGTEVLLTNQDYGAMTLAWQRWANVRDWSMRTLEMPFGRDVRAEQLVELFKHAMTPSTRILFLYHATSPTGLVLPLKEICALARERDIVTVVDGAHAPGMVPVNLAEIGADYYAANLHKWMMCPAGGGFLHVARHRRTDLRALITSWGFGYNRSEAFEDSGNGGQRWQWDMEFHGTVDRVPQMVVPAALEFREKLSGGGGDAVLFKQIADLAGYAREVVPARSGLVVGSPDDLSLCGGLVVFDLPGKCDPIAVRDRMYNEFNIEAPVTQAGERQYLRVSTALFNTRGDVDAVAAAAGQIWPR